MAAAVYASSEGLTTIVLEAAATGGQAGTSPRIENYLGFPAGISGADLAERAVIQAGKFGAQIVVPAEGIALDPGDGYHTVRIDDGTSIAAVHNPADRHRRPEPQTGRPWTRTLEGVSVYYAATLIEARAALGGPAIVVGGGNSAGQAALFLADHAEQVTLVIRSNLGKEMSRYLVDQLERHPTVEILEHTEVSELIGQEALRAVIVEKTIQAPAGHSTHERSSSSSAPSPTSVGSKTRSPWTTTDLY